MKSINHTLLLVDDDFMYRLKLKRHLARFKTLLEAESLKDAFEVIMANPDIDLIMLDLGLPDSNDDPVQTVDKIIEFIKAAEHVEDIPVVILTGNNNEDIWQKAMVAGAQEYLEKDRVTDGYVIEKVIRSAIFRKAQEAIIVDDRIIYSEMQKETWWIYLRLQSLLTLIPARDAVAELMAIFKAVKAVPKTANRGIDKD